MLPNNDKFDLEIVLQLLARGLPYYLKSWKECDGATGLFGATDPDSFNMKSMGSSSPVIEYVVRPHIHVLCVLAAVLYRPESVQDLDNAITLDKAGELLNKGVRWMCETHLSGQRDVDSFLIRKRWGENWRSSLWAAQLALAVTLGKNNITEELYERVKEIVAFEADRFIGIFPPSGCEEDTKIEENAMDVMVMAWAINMCPDHEHAADWQKALDVWAINIASSIQDKKDHTEYAGKSVSYWIRTENLFPDMTTENHGFFHPETLMYGMWVVIAMAAYALHDRHIPTSLLRKCHEEVFDVLLPFCLPNGLFFSPGGQDLPMFIPRPFGLAWGLWNSDPRALRMTERLLSWMKSTVLSQSGGDEGPLVFGFTPAYEGWELFFQSVVGFELAMLLVLPFPREFRFFTPGQIESAVDKREIYSYVQLCFRRNTKTTRSVAWKTLEHHPMIGLNIHDYPELVAPFKAALLGIPAVKKNVRHWEVAFHTDKEYKDGFDTSGQVLYYDSNNDLLMTRIIRVITWGDEGMLVFDDITANQPLLVEEQYLSPVYLVNDHWTHNNLALKSGSLTEHFNASQHRMREVSCPAFWASVENHFLIQLIWGIDKGLVYVPGGERNAPPYWNNCRLDMLACHVEAKNIEAGGTVSQVGFYVGAGKAPRPIKCTGNAGNFFKGLVIIDGKNTIGLD